MGRGGYPRVPCEAGTGGRELPRKRGRVGMGDGAGITGREWGIRSLPQTRPIAIPNTATTSKVHLISFAVRSSAIIHTSQISPGDVLTSTLLSKNYAHNIYKRHYKMNYPASWTFYRTFSSTCLTTFQDLHN